MKFTALIVVALLSTNACSDKKTDTTETSTLWVNSEKVPCEGVAPQQCLQVQRGEILQEDAWELLYTNIEGFDYESGFIYKLKIAAEKLNPATVPADASSIKYTLIEVLDKKEVLVFADQRLHDIWALEAIAGKPLETSQFSGRNRQPVLEIFIKEKRIGGTDGCNNLFGQITTVTGSKISFDKIGGTKMACSDMSLSYKYGQALAATKTYKLDGLKLFFFDTDGKEVLQFKKVD